MKEAARTLVVGESLIDIVHRAGQPAVEHVGGSPLNVAVGLTRLGHPVELSTYLGDDEHGTAILDHLRIDGLTLTAGSTGADRTPTATAILDESGSATYEFDLVWDLPYPMPAEFDHFHTGSIASALQPGAERVRDWMLAAREHATTSFDPNVRPTLIGAAADNRAILEQLIGLADVVKASDEDISWLYGDAAPVEQILPLWARLGPSVVVATRGGDGALVHLMRTGKTLELPGRTVDLVDTVGAGDSFQSGLISGMLDAGLLGGTEARRRLLSADADAVLPAVQRAIDASAITVSRAGAQPPTRAELP